jgi:hypothetical protein
VEFDHQYHSRRSPRRLFEVYRDALVDFAPQLSGVARVDARFAADDGDCRRLVHRWTGDPSVLPGMLRLLVPGFMFVWEDRTVWDARRLLGQWTVTAPYLGPMVRIEGRHRFLPHAAGCEVRVDGALHVAMVERLGGARLDRAVQDLFHRVLSSAGTVIERHLDVSASPE